MTAFTATAIGLAVVATLLFVTAVALFFQWDIPTAWKELKGQTFTDTVEALTKALSSEGAVESYRKLAALSLTEASPFSNHTRQRQPQRRPHGSRTADTPPGVRTGS